MVQAHGMSKKVGMVTLERERQPQFVQIQPSQEKGDYSEAGQEIDSEIRRIIDEHYEPVKQLLGRKRAYCSKVRKCFWKERSSAGPS